LQQISSSLPNSNFYQHHDQHTSDHSTVSGHWTVKLSLLHQCLVQTWNILPCSSPVFGPDPEHSAIFFHLFVMLTSLSSWSGGYVTRVIFLIDS